MSSEARRMPRVAEKEATKAARRDGQPAAPAKPAEAPGLAISLEEVPFVIDRLRATNSDQVMTITVLETRLNLAMARAIAAETELAKAKERIASLEGKKPA